MVASNSRPPKRRRRRTPHEAGHTLGITLRLPVELHTHLSEAADAAGASLNLEMVRRLERSFADDHQLATKADLAELKRALLHALCISDISSGGVRLNLEV
jgi:hypothetical protein